MKLKSPNTQLTFILYHMINSDKGIAERDTNFNMFRGYISLIRKVVDVKHTEVPFKNVFGHKGKYRRHWLTNSDKKKAAKYYQSLFKKAA